MKFRLLQQPVDLLKFTLIVFSKKKYSRERTLLAWLYEISEYHCPVSGYFWADLFQAWWDARHDKVYRMISV